MRAGQLRNRIKVYEAETVRSPMGGAGTVKWVHKLTLNANFEPLSVRDVLNARAAQSETRARCRIRYRDDITSKMRIEHRGRVYEIDGDPLPDRHSGTEYQTLMLKSV